MTDPTDPHAEVVDRNRQAWDEVAQAGDQLYHGVSTEQIAAARQGEFRIIVTPTISVPLDWFGELQQRDVLALACGGGQQAPLLAAAGANVTVFDLSPKQLERDREIATRESLDIKTVAGDMRDLSVFADQSFDLILNPTSVCFCPEVLPVWREAFRVLRPGGCLITGFHQPLYYLFDKFEMDDEVLKVVHKIPYSDFDLSEEDRDALLGDVRPVEFSHTLDELVGGQLKTGFQITNFYTDRWGGEDRLSELIDLFMATRAVKPS